MTDIIAVEDKFHKSGNASFCPPDNSAHISSHNAVDPGASIQGPEAAVRKRMQEIHQRRLEDQYEKARKRAEKKGRKLPPRQQYYDHWGYSYYSESEKFFSRSSTNHSRV